MRTEGRPDIDERGNRRFFAGELVDRCCPKMPLKPWEPHAVPVAELAGDAERLRAVLAL